MAIHTVLETDTQDIYYITRAARPPRTRTRTSSLLSISSGVSLGFEITKAQSTSGLSYHTDTHHALGAFIPVRPAMSTLKDFASYISPPVVRAPKRRRRVTFNDKCTYSPSMSDEENEASSSSSHAIPYITRSTAPSPIIGPPSPSSTVSSLSGAPRQRHHHTSGNDLHPVLAHLERTSRLCTQVNHCSTCLKKGNDFPRCPKCGDMWCSRQCRLVNGKRHVCSDSGPRT